jgi:hypothetical protein
MDQHIQNLDQQQEESRHGCLGISIIAVILVCSIVIACKFIEHYTSDEDAEPAPVPSSPLPEPAQVDEGAQIIQLTPEQWTEHMDALNGHRSALNEHRTLVNQLRSEIYTLKQEVQALEKQVKHLEQQVGTSSSAKR